MTMHDDTRKVMELLTEHYPRAEVVGVAQARMQIAEYARAGAGTGEPVARVEDRTVPGPAGDIPVRLYWPAQQDRVPAIAFFHGGGFTICNLDTHDGTCRALANRAGALVMSVDYRLAPEHRFPAAHDDCRAATEWLAANAASLGADATRLAVAGDSAGGNLAATVALAARDAGGPPLAFQLLVYPVTDFSEGRHAHASHRENGEGYFLTHSATEWFRGQYLGSEADADHPLASPLVAPDLSGLPPAMVVTAEFDPLRDEGEAYGRRLAEAGVPVEVVRVPGMFHGFFSMGALLPAAAETVDAAGAALRRALHPS